MKPILSTLGVFGLAVFTAAAVVPNDHRTNALVIPGLPFTNVVNIADATVEPDDFFSCGFNSETVWYAYTPDRAQVLQVDLSASDHAASWAVLTNSPFGLLTVQCGSTTDLPGSQPPFRAAAGVTYLIKAGRLNFNPGPGSNLVFRLREIPPPANDNFDDALVVTTFPFSNRVDFAAATSENGDPNPCGFGADDIANVWYVITLQEDLFVKLDCAGPASGVRGAIFTGPRDALQGSGCFGFPFGFAARAGETYYILVEDTSGGGGFPPQAERISTCIFTARPKLRIAVTFDQVSPVDNRTGLVTVRGTLTASQNVEIFLLGGLRQRVGRKTLITGPLRSGPFNELFIPTPGQADFTASVLGTNGSFGSGTALVLGQAFASFQGDSEFIEFAQTIRLSPSRK